MNHEIGDPRRTDEDIDVDDDVDVEDTETEFSDDTIVLEDIDDDDDVSVEVNVEKLIAELESAGDQDVARKKEIRRRLEELAEERSFEDTYAFEMDEKSD